MLTGHKKDIVMKRNVVYAVRVIMMMIVLTLGILGYIYYEKTLVVWWLPVVVAVTAVVATIPWSRSGWRWFVGDDKTFNTLCHIFAVGCITYFLMMGGNYLLADKDSMQKEEVMVEDKKHNVRKTGYRSGRHYRRSNRTTHSYYLTVRLDDGTLKEMPVTASLYNRVRAGRPIEICLQEGALGFRVIKED